MPIAPQHKLNSHGWLPIPAHAYARVPETGGPAERLVPHRRLRPWRTTALMGRCRVYLSRAAMRTGHGLPAQPASPAVPAPPPLPRPELACDRARPGQSGRACRHDLLGMRSDDPPPGHDRAPRADTHSGHGSPAPVSTQMTISSSAVPSHEPQAACQAGENRPCPRLIAPSTGRRPAAAAAAAWWRGSDDVGSGYRSIAGQVGGQLVQVADGLGGERPCPAAR